MTGPLRIHPLAILAVTVAACTHAVQVLPITEPVARSVGTCGDIAVDTTGWVSTLVTDLGIEFQRPPSFQPQQIAERERPGWGAYSWRRDGSIHERLEAHVLNRYAALDKEAQRARWEREPGARTCAFSRDGQSAYVVVLDESRTSEGFVDDALPPVMVVAEWTFSPSRIVRLRAIAQDPDEIAQVLAIVRSVRFTASPVPPEPCRPPYNCGGLPE